MKNKHNVDLKVSSKGITRNLLSFKLCLNMKLCLFPLFIFLATTPNCLCPMMSSSQQQFSGFSVMLANIYQIRLYHVQAFEFILDSIYTCSYFNKLHKQRYLTSCQKMPPFPDHMMFPNDLNFNPYWFPHLCILQGTMCTYRIKA